MFGPIITFAENLIANWVANAFGPTSMVGLTIAILVIMLSVIGWHRRQRAAKKLGMASWQFIALCGVIAILAIAGSAFGLGLRFSGKFANLNPSINVQGISGPTTPPAPTAGDVTTSLTLHFSHGMELPVAISLENIWRWYALATLAVPANQIKAWSVFLTFDRPIDVKQIIISSKGTLPAHEVKDRDSRSAIIAFTGDLIDVDVEIKVVGNPLTQSPPATATAQPSAKPTKNYFPAEKIKLGNLLSTISDQLNGDALTAAKQGYRYYDSTMPASKVELEALMHQVEGTENLVHSAWTQIWDTVDNNPKFKVELVGIVGQREGHSPNAMTPINKFYNSLELLHRDLSILVDRIDELPERDRAWIILGGVKRSAENVVYKSNDFQAWISECNGRIDNMREALR